MNYKGETESRVTRKCCVVHVITRIRERHNAEQPIALRGLTIICAEGIQNWSAVPPARSFNNRRHQVINDVLEVRIFWINKYAYGNFGTYIVTIELPFTIFMYLGKQ